MKASENPTMVQVQSFMRGNDWPFTVMPNGSLEGAYYSECGLSCPVLVWLHEGRGVLVAALVGLLPEKCNNRATINAALLKANMKFPGVKISCDTDGPIVMETFIDVASAPITRDRFNRAMVELFSVGRHVFALGQRISWAGMSVEEAFSVLDREIAKAREEAAARETPDRRGAAARNRLPAN